MTVQRRIVIAAAALAWASTVHAAGVSDTEIVLGSHIDLSGPAAAGMPMLRNAMQLLIDEASTAARSA
jgi:hypothetical protein